MTSDLQDKFTAAMALLERALDFEQRRYIRATLVIEAWAAARAAWWEYEQARAQRPRKDSAA